MASHLCPIPFAYTYIVSTLTCFILRPIYYFPGTHFLNRCLLYSFSVEKASSSLTTSLYRGHFPLLPLYFTELISLSCSITPWRSFLSPTDSPQRAFPSPSASVHRGRFLLYRCSLLKAFPSPAFHLSSGHVPPHLHLTEGIPLPSCSSQKAFPVVLRVNILWFPLAAYQHCGQLLALCCYTYVLLIRLFFCCCYSYVIVVGLC